MTPRLISPSHISTRTKQPPDVGVQRRDAESEMCVVQETLAPASWILAIFERRAAHNRLLVESPDLAAHLIEAPDGYGG